MNSLQTGKEGSWLSNCWLTGRRAMVFKMLKAHLLLLAFVATVTARAVLHDTVILEHINSPPSSFIAHGPADSETTLNLRIGLRQRDMAGLEKALYATSTPGSDQYGEFLSREEIREYVKPLDESLRAVNDWLSSNGLSGESVSYAGDWLAVSVPVGKANEMLDADYSVYEDQNGNRIVRTLSYSVPSALKNHIHLIHPTVNFGPSHSLRPKTITRATSIARNPSLPSSCQKAITPQCLQTMYNIPSTPATQSNNQLFVSGFAGEFPSSSDLTEFLKLYRTDMSSDTSFTVQSIDGGVTSGSAGSEANLDIQYTVGIATGVPVTFVSVGPSNATAADTFFQAVLNQANSLITMENPPTVISASYSFNEASISPAMAVSICNNYMQLGAMGVSVLYASGDDGVAGSQLTPCYGKPFSPVFPATCPYVTSVGATQLSFGNATEEAASLSAGGFSNYFSQPSYQSTAVKTFLTNLGSTYAGLYNASGRGFPDVAANGVKYTIMFDESRRSEDGTSCATPTFASVIALLNDALISAGKPVLGFLNPFLYSVGASALTDITIGSNPGCGTDGFSAVTGWDPVSGLGTPNYTALLGALGL